MKLKPNLLQSFLGRLRLPVFIILLLIAVSGILFSGCHGGGSGTSGGVDTTDLAGKPQTIVLPRYYVDSNTVNDWLDDSSKPHSKVTFITFFKNSNMNLNSGSYLLAMMLHQSDSAFHDSSIISMIPHAADTLTFTNSFSIGDLEFRVKDLRNWLDSNGHQGKSANLIFKPEFDATHHEGNQLTFEILIAEPGFGKAAYSLTLDPSPPAPPVDKK
jgi:hypothetical protein